MTGFLYVVALLLVIAIATYFLFPKQIVRLMIAAGRHSAELSTKSCEVDGDTWHYLEGGPADGETILLVHGFGTDKDSWVLYARELTRAYRVIAPDLPGFGDSARREDRDYRVRAQTERLHAFVEELNLPDVHLVGNSMGGHIAGLYALAYPERLATLALFNNAGVDVPTKSELVREIDDGRNPLVVNTMQEFERMLDMVTYKKFWMPGILKKFAFERAVSHRAFNDRIFWSIVEDSPQTFFNSRLADISVPTLIVWGRHDALIDVSCVDVMVAKIPNNKAVILEETGHAPMFEQPKVTASHHKAFIVENSGVRMPQTLREAI